MHRVIRSIQDYVAAEKLYGQALECAREIDDMHVASAWLGGGGRGAPKKLLVPKEHISNKTEFEFDIYTRIFVHCLQRSNKLKT